MTDPHGDGQLRTAGEPLSSADAAVVLAHGRGATAESILQTAEAFSVEEVAYLAPQAQNNTWYPNSFLEPVDSNEPGRTSGLAAIDRAVTAAVDEGVPTERVLIGGFSQGACLASEYVARNPAMYGGLVVLSGGLIGDTIDPTEFDGDCGEMPVLLGCSDRDPHIPEQRVHVTADVFESLGAQTDTRIYEGMGHQINQDEADRVREMTAGLLTE
ncbi:MAG: putative esterase [uncultured archaeon A07HR60]|jgi:Predicted esterase|nr:MAG: putative esterase [Halorubrum sp. J07HR59]ESS10451.1 MAG: putative esterase [uncultured archaeon A07HR60]